MAVMLVSTSVVTVMEWSGSQARACTSGGAMGVATSDGRPMIWQNNDWSVLRVTLKKFDGEGYDAIEVLSTGSYGTNALNSQGLAYVTNRLEIGTMTDLAEVSIKLQRECASLEDVTDYLDSRGEQQIGQNFVLMDRYGKVRDFEIGGSDYWSYDPENATRQKQSYFASPRLFVTRANRSFQNTSQQEPDDTVASWDSASSVHRYTTARTLFQEKITDGNKLTIADMMAISRDGNPGFDEYTICNPRLGGTGASLWGTIALGVVSDEDPRYATLLMSLGIPDYSIYIPVWVDLSQDELSEHVKTWDANNIGWWAFELYEDRFDDTPDYDEYIRGVLAPVEDNIIAAVEAARSQWLDNGNTERAHQEMKNMHNYAAYAAYYTIKSAHATAADGDGTRNCSRPPTITSLGVSANGLEVSFAHDATDPDVGDTVNYNRWRFGDGETVTETATPTHTYSQPGTYQVMAFVGSGSGDRYAANVRFEYITVPPSSECGDSTCDSPTEDCFSCPADCGACCGDGSCEAWNSEDCESCPADCPTSSGSVCCAGATHPGDCCDDDDCVVPDTCVGYSCLPPSACEVDVDGDHYGVGPSCAGPDCDDNDATIHPGAEEQFEACDDGVDNDCDDQIDAHDSDCTEEPPGGGCRAAGPGNIPSPVGAWVLIWMILHLVKRPQSIGDSSE